MQLIEAALWWFGDAVLALLIYRGKGRLIREYPYFYAYLALVLCSQGAEIYMHFAHRGQPSEVANYWLWEFLTAGFGCGVTWQIYADTLAPYQGVRRMARAVLCGLFVTVLLRSLTQISTGLQRWAAGPITASSTRRLGTTTGEVFSNLRLVEALVLLAIVSLIIYYGLPMGRNLRAMLVGYGLFVGVDVITVNFFSRLRLEWVSVARQVLYCVTLIIWCTGLWAYSSNPDADMAIEQDYERIAGQTVRAFGRLRNHLIHSWRS